MTGGPQLSGYLGPQLLPLLGDAVTVVGPDWRYAYVSPSAAELIGRRPEDCVGAHVWEVFPEVVGTPQHAAVVRAMEQRTREVFSWHFANVGRWYEQHALPVGDGLVVYVLDITDRMAEVTRAEHLAAAGEALAGAVTLEDVHDALRAHVLHLVEASGGAIILADDERSLMRALGWASVGQDAVAGWSEFPAHALTPSATAHRTGQPVFVDSLEDARCRFPPIAAELERLGCGPAAALPLVSAGVRLGAWSLLFPAGRELTGGDRRFLVTAAAMIAQALLRARLHDAERRGMAQLQRSLLPRHLVTTPGLDLAARYAAGDAAVEVGGDWYDVVHLAGGAVGLVLGDVEGHDVEAAACMGLVRSAVRAYAAEGHPPSIVLELANRFVHDIALGRLVTLTYAALHPLEHLVTTISAGHLPLQVVSPDGQHREVPHEVGPPLGVHPTGVHWPETTSTLPAGALLCAFTDGLVEARDEDIGVGLARLKDTLVTHRADASADTVADAVLAGRSSRSGDDVALLVGRLTAAPADEQRYTRRMPATSASVFLARRSTAQLLAAWNVAPTVVEAAELIVSELVTNAARHSEDAVDVVLSCPDGVLRIEVGDSSHRMPVLPLEELDDDATSGRGLMIVDALADRWGVQSDGLGKRVWAEIALPV